MAIIVRSPGQIVQALQRSFSINHIPLTIDTQALALKENPAVKPLLEIALFSLDPSLLVPSQWGRIEAILTSDFVGADRLELRQMRMALAKERDENNRENQDDSRTTTEIMIDVIKDPTHTSLVDVKALERLRDLLVAARKANKSRNVSDLLWAIWDNARQANGEKVATAWREKALKGGARGAAADRDLDAIINLFDSAKRFVDRNPGLDSKAFIDYMFTQRFAADAISFEAQREDSVTLKTVHSAKGLEWELVVIPNLQQGQWPNMKERGSLLGSERITERVFSQINVKQVLDSSTTSKLAQDEKRLFESAKRRARSRVILTAIEAEDLFPSTYFFESADEKSLKDFKPQRGLNSHILIAQLRDDLLNPEKRDFAARLLNKVASQGMSAADPDQWLGALEPSTNAPVVRPHEDIYVSPSSIQSFEDCALKWFLEKSGAQDGDSSAQLLGVAIHKLAAMVHEDKTLDVTSAKKRLLESWKVVDQSIGWFKEAELNRASEMLDAFFNWHATQGNELVKVEENFEVKIHDRVVLHGQVDRLEKDSDGNIFIVDIKTGATITKPEAEKNRQMNAYQVAANEGGFKEQTGSTSSSGSALLYVGDTPASVRPQAPVTDPDVKEGIVETGLKMGSNNFVAVINKNCRTCRVSHICPLQAEGRSVID